MINILWRKGLASFTQLVKVRRGKFFLCWLQPPGGCKGMCLLDCNQSIYQSSITPDPQIYSRSALLLLPGPNPSCEPIQVVIGWWWWWWWWWGWWGWAVHIEGGEGGDVRPCHSHHLAPPRFRRWWREKAERARGWKTCLSHRGLVGSCPLVPSGSCTSATMAATLSRSWMQGWCPSWCWRWRWRWSRSRLKVQLGDRDASLRRESKSHCCASFFQIFKDFDEFLKFCLHFCPRYLELRSGESSKKDFLTPLSMHQS